MLKKEILTQIDPKLSDCGKYSPNLFKWVKKNFWQNEPCNAFSFQRNDWDGSFMPFDKENLVTPSLIIGDYAQQTGARLSQILIGGKGYLQRWAYTSKHAEHGCLDLSEWFWGEYIRNGRALFGNGPFMGDEDRWTYVGNTRRCNWSGKWYNAQVKKSVRVSRKKVWVPASAEASS